MRSSVAIAFFAVHLTLVGCVRQTPTDLPVPSGAKEFEAFAILNGQAHQTSFVIDAKFPAAPALAHYAAQMKEPWVRCEWSGPKWQSFLDGTIAPPKTVHQQLHMWVNPQARRTLMVSMRYLSSQDCVGDPDNDRQHVIVVEYFGQDVKDTISWLKLKCPAEVMSSNSSSSGRDVSAVR